MTSKVAQQAPRDPTDLELADLTQKDEVKASGTIPGSEEPTNASSAGNLNPGKTKDHGPKLTEAQVKGDPAQLSQAETSPAANGGITASPTEPAKPIEKVSLCSKMRELRKIARKPGLRVEVCEKEEMTELVDSYKVESFGSQNSAQILGKRRRKRESASDSYRELIDNTEVLQEHHGHRVQTPQIFEKTLQLPPRLPGLTNTGASVFQSNSNARVSDGIQQGQYSGPASQALGQNGVRLGDKAQNSVKRTSLPVLTREDAALVDYDFGLCSNQIELQKNQNKCFENMLDLINLTYFGTQPSIQMGVQPRQDLALVSGPSTMPARKETSTSNNRAASNGGGQLSRLPPLLMSREQIDTSQKSHERLEGDLQSAQDGQEQVACRSGTAALAMNDTSKRMKLSQLDYLANPLRTDHPFEIWSPKEIALFTACICQFGKRFDLFVPLIKTKSQQEVYEFYRCWKYTKYYKTWKLKSKDRPKHNLASLNDIIFHERQI